MGVSRGCGGGGRAYCFPRQGRGVALGIGGLVEKPRNDLQIKYLFFHDCAFCLSTPRPIPTIPGPFYGLAGTSFKWQPRRPHSIAAST